jgi:TrmH family RNA methyltransferase
MSVITSLSNPKIKEAVKLREGKHRRRSGKFLIDGTRELDRALQAGIRVLELFTVHPFTAASLARNEKIRVQQVTESVMEKISFGDRNEGIVAVAEEPAQSFEVFEAKIGAKICPLLAVLEGIEKPGNLGAIFRSADAAGVDGVMIADSFVDPFHSNSIRSSMGTVFSIPMVCASSADVCRWLKERNFQIAATRCSGEAMPYAAVNFCRPTAIVLGSEAEGLSDVWSGKDTTAITVPMLGIADSLNVSVTAGILFYEAQRQRSSSESQS